MVIEPPSRLSEQVRQAVRSEPGLPEALARRLVNHRALARWLLEEKRVEGTEEAVVSALRRIHGALGGASHDVIDAVLGDGQVGTQSGMCSFTLHLGTRLSELVPELSKRIDTTRGDTLIVVSSSRGAKVIVDERNVERIADLLPRAARDHAKRDLTMIAIGLPPAAAGTPGVIARITGALASEGINVAELVDGVGQHLVFVTSDDALRAYALLADIIHGSRRRRGRSH